MPVGPTFVAQAWIPWYGQVEPASAIGRKEAAKAGCAAVTVPAHRAVSAAPTITISRARVLRTLIMTPPRAPGVAAPPPCPALGPGADGGGPTAGMPAP